MNVESRIVKLGDRALEEVVAELLAELGPCPEWAKADGVKADPDPVVYLYDVSVEELTPVEMVKLPERDLPCCKVPCVPSLDGSVQVCYITRTVCPGF